MAEAGRTEVRKYRNPRARATTPLAYVKQTWNSFSEDDCMTLGAAMAYYSVFSLAPMLLTIVSIVGWYLAGRPSRTRSRAKSKGSSGRAQPSKSNLCWQISGRIIPAESSEPRLASSP